MPKIGLVLSGCGVYDGAEIHEAVIALLALDRAGAEVVVLAPDIEQLHTVNHLTGTEMSVGQRNVLLEAARIARGNIRELAQMDGSQLDGLVLPGGFGVAKNLSDYAMVGAECEVNPGVLRIVAEILAAGKPVGAICIAPVLIAKILQKLDRRGVCLTIGSDANTAADIEAMGSKHVSCPVEDIVVDAPSKIVTTPAYMLGTQISAVAAGIEKLIAKVLELAREN